MAKYYSIKLYINPRTANYLLNGLAKAYNEMPVYVTNYSEIKSEIKLAVEDILSQLEKQGIEVTKKRGQFERYCKMIEYKSKN